MKFGRVLFRSSAEESEVPPRAAEIAVGRELQAAVLLVGDDLPDLGIFDRLQLFGRDRVHVALRARVLDRGGAQETADVIGAEQRGGALHVNPTPLQTPRRCGRASPTARPRS